MSRGLFWKTSQSKLLVLLALNVTSAVTCITVTLSISHSYSTRYLAALQKNRAPIQIIVHIISATLGSLQIYVLSSLIQFRTNIRLCKEPTSLDELKLHSALNSGKLDFDLPYMSLFGVLAYVAVIQIPAAIWAGALTPVIISASSPAIYRIPFYNPLTINNWAVTCRPATKCANTASITTDQGTFTNLAWKLMSGLLLNSLSEASSSNSSVPQHKKLDNSGFSFYGRSYGVGSGVGLVDSPTLVTPQNSNSTPSVTYYEYAEIGYISGVHCIYNESSNLSFADLQWIQGEDKNQVVTVLQAVGSLPTGEWTGFTTMSYYGNGTAVALAAQANDTEYLYGFIGGYHYHYLNHAQCEVTFTPTLFNIGVDVVAQNITVTPAASGDININLDPSGGLVNGTFYSLNFLSQIMSTMYTGVFGDAFTRNINATQARENHVNRTQSDILTGLTEGLEFLLDFYLGTIGASQLMLFDESMPVNATMEFNAVQLGEPVYAYLSFSINLGIVILYIFEVIRTRFWKDLPLFNSLDTKSVILGFAGNRKEPLTSVRNWAGDAADRDAGRLTVKLGSSKTVLNLNTP